MDYGYTVTIPTFVLLDSNLAPAERILYGVLSLMTNSKGFCLATNEVLADHVRFKVDKVTKQVSVDWVDKSLAKLEELGYIRIESEVARTIIVMFQKVDIKISVKASKPSAQLEMNTDLAKKVLQYFSDARITRGYSKKPLLQTKNNLEPISGRIQEGRTYEEMISVINIKFEDKYFQDNLKYLVPQTVFRPSNFEKYLAESASVKDIHNKVITKYGLSNTSTAPSAPNVEGVAF